jgi:hypothetical protein
MFDYPRLISNAERAYSNAQSDWAKEYWLEVITKLKQNIDSH